MSPKRLAGVHALVAVASLGVIVAVGASATDVFAHDSGFGLVRYMPDGSLDETFGVHGIVMARSADRAFVANNVTVQDDGSILVAGMVSDPASASVQMALQRYSLDGALDASFGTAGTAICRPGAAGGEARAIAIQADHKILVGGTAYAGNSAGDAFALARFDADGSLDQSFGHGGSISLQPGGATAQVGAVLMRPDGRIVIAGTAFASGAADDHFVMARFLADGRLDPEFGSGGLQTTDSASADRLGSAALLADGEVVLAGTSRGTGSGFLIARYKANGSIDYSFGQGGTVRVPASEQVQVHALLAPDNGGLVVVGSGASVSGSVPFAVVRVSRDGLADMTLTPFQGSRSGARAVVAQPDGKLVVGGASSGAVSANGNTPIDGSGFALVRFNADGSVEATFGGGGAVRTGLGDAGATPVSLAVQPDGKIVATGLVFFTVASENAARPDWRAVSAAGAAFASLLALGALLRGRRAKAL